MERNGWIGKKVSVFFDDGSKITRHDGICTSYSDNEICLDYKEIIPKARIIRIEVVR